MQLKMRAQRKFSKQHMHSHTTVKRKKKVQHNPIWLVSAVSLAYHAWSNFRYPNNHLWINKQLNGKITMCPNYSS